MKHTEKVVTIRKNSAALEPAAEISSSIMLSSEAQIGGGSIALVSSRSTRRQWTNGEDELLRRAEQQHGGLNWKAISAHLVGRTPVECLHRWNEVWYGVRHKIPGLIKRDASENGRIQKKAKPVVVAPKKIDSSKVKVSSSVMLSSKVQVGGSSTVVTDASENGRISNKAKPVVVAPRQKNTSKVTTDLKGAEGKPRIYSSKCSLCLDTKPLTNFQHNLCGYKHVSIDEDPRTESSVCRDCIVAYISAQISSSAIGTCRPIYCPLIHTDVHDGKPVKRIISYKRWSKVVKPDVISAHEKLCQSVLQFRCCNPVSSAYNIATTPKNLVVTKAATFNVQNLLSSKNRSVTTAKPQLIDALTKQIEQFEVNEIGVDVIFRAIINTYFPVEFSSVTDEQNTGKWRIMMSILQLIGDPERRSTLQLRYYNHFPRFTATICCHAEICFRCKSGWHNGKTCTSFSSGFNNDLVVCPSCSNYLTRSEGCDQVVCICGYSLNWSSELAITRNIANFVKTHGDNALQACVGIITTDEQDQDATAVTLATSWRQRHQNEVNVALLKWWHRKYDPLCSPAACAMIIDQRRCFVDGMYLDRIPHGIVDAAILWSYAHKSELQKFRDERAISIRSTFPSLFPEVGSQSRLQAFASIVVLGAGFFVRQKVYSSRDDADRLIQSAEYWISQADNRKKYDDEVKFQEKRLVNAFLGINAKGLASKEAGEKCGAQSLWEKFGSVFMSPTEVDVKESRNTSNHNFGSCQVKLLLGGGKQAGEMKSNKEDLPTDMMSQDALTTRCVDNPNLAITVSGIALLQIYSSYLRRVLTSSVDTRPSAVHGADCYIKYCEENSIINPVEFLLTSLSPVIRDISEVTSGFGWSAYAGENPTVVARLRSIITNAGVVVATRMDLFRLVYFGACYMSLHHEALQQRQMQLHSEEFIRCHGINDAPFIAASTLAQCNSGFCSGIKPRERVLAQSFMKVNSERMHQWYYYNAQLKEPLFGLDKCDKGCFCLPRHEGRCPHPDYKRLEQQRLKAKRNDNTAIHTVQQVTNRESVHANDDSLKPQKADKSGSNLAKPIAKPKLMVGNTVSSTGNGRSRQTGGNRVGKREGT